MYISDFQALGTWVNFIADDETAKPVCDNYKGVSWESIDVCALPSKSPILLLTKN